MNWVLLTALGLAPGLIWLFFFLREDDRHPEPPKMIGLTFLFGAFSAMVALVFQAALNSTLQNKIIITLPRIIEENISAFIVFAIIEEVVKFLLVFLVVRKSKHFNEPIDGMIYMITGALGFATVENMFLVFSSADGDVMSMILLRFVGATLLHALSSGIIGHYWARGIIFKMEGRFLLAGVVMASVFHILFNLLVVKFDDLVIYPTALLGLVGFFVLYDFEELKRISVSPEPTPPTQ